MYVEDCTFNATNSNTGITDGFAAFVFQGDYKEQDMDIEADVVNCYVNISGKAGSATSYLMISQYNDRKGGAQASLGISFTVSGEKTNIKGPLVFEETDCTNIDYKNTISFEAGLYTNDPTSYVDAEKYDVVTLKDGDAGYSDGYRYKVVAKSSN